MRKRICSFLMLLCLLAASIGASPCAAYAKASDPPAVYTAFGDSIAAGYGLNGYTDSQDTPAAPAQSYQALTAAFLKTKSNNYAVTGSDSDDCIELLTSQKADADLAATDVITLSIGSNDLLLPFIQIVMDDFQIDPSAIDPAQIEDQIKNGFTLPQMDLSQMAEFYKKAEALLTELSDHATLHAQARAFTEKFQTILSLLHEKAPGAEIYVTNIYNPFAFLPKIGELADRYIQEINQAFSKDAPDYTLIDVYTPFQEQELTNVQADFQQPASFSLDPHPSVQGHAVIADLIIRACKDAHSPKPAVLRSLYSDSKKKLTAQIKLPADADGYQLLYAADKKGTYKKLGKGTSGQKTFQTSSKKLKSQKTYYFKVRSYQVVKGVTYYGKDSNILKIKIS